MRSMPVSCQPMPSSRPDSQSAGEATRSEGPSDFEHFPHAPIVEAVIEFRARVELPWDETTVTDRLRRELPEYSNHQPMREFSFAVSMSSPAALPVQSSSDVSGAAASGPSAVGEDHGWIGVRALTADNLQVANFSRDLFSFSRLKPYGTWETFSSEALRLWAVHQALSGISHVHRLGVRFINRIEVPADDVMFDDYFEGLGTSPLELDTTGFLHQHSFAVPNEPYGVNLARTFQPPGPPDPTRLALLLDIDAFTSEPFPADPGMIAGRLVRLRTLKNEMFRGSLTDRAMDLFR
jgi:uncharacterized protein (TIGR04255 family)